MTSLFVVGAVVCFVLPIGLALKGFTRRAVYFAVMVVLLLVGPASFMQGRTTAAQANAAALGHITLADGLDPNTEMTVANIETFGGVLCIVSAVGCLLGGILWLPKKVQL